MIDVSRLAERSAPARVESPTVQLLVSPGQGASSAAKNAALFRRGIRLRKDVSALLRARLPQRDPGPVPTLIGQQVRRARALLAQRRQEVEEAVLDTIDADITTLAGALEDR